MANDIPDELLFVTKDGQQVSQTRDGQPIITIKQDDNKPIGSLLVDTVEQAIQLARQIFTGKTSIESLPVSVRGEAPLQTEANTIEANAPGASDTLAADEAPSTPTIAPAPASTSPISDSTPAQQAEALRNAVSNPETAAALGQATHLMSSEDALKVNDAISSAGSSNNNESTLTTASDLTTEINDATTRVLNEDINNDYSAQGSVTSSGTTATAGDTPGIKSNDQGAILKDGKQAKVGSSFTQDGREYVVDTDGAATLKSAVSPTYISSLQTTGAGPKYEAPAPHTKIETDVTNAVIAGVAPSADAKYVDVVNPNGGTITNLTQEEAQAYVNNGYKAVTAGAGTVIAGGGAPSGSGPYGMNMDALAALPPENQAAVEQALGSLGF